MKLMTFVYIGIAVVFLATIIIMLLQKYSPTKGKRQTRRGIIALACWGLGIALIFLVQNIIWHRQHLLLLSQQ